MDRKNQPGQHQQYQPGQHQQYQPSYVPPTGQSGQGPQYNFTANPNHTTQHGFAGQRPQSYFTSNPNHTTQQFSNLSDKFEPSARFEDSKRSSTEARKYNAFGNKKSKTGPKKIAASIKLAVWFLGGQIEPVESMEHKFFFEEDVSLNLQLHSIKKCINQVYVKKGSILDTFFMEYQIDTFFGFCTPAYLPIASEDVSISDYFTNFLNPRKFPKDKRFVIVYLDVRLVLQKNSLNVISFVKDASNDSVPIVTISEDDDPSVNLNPDIIQNIRSRDDVLGNYMTYNVEKAKFEMIEILVSDLVEPDWTKDCALGGAKKCFKEGQIYEKSLGKLQNLVFKHHSETKDDAQSVFAGNAVAQSWVFYLSQIFNKAVENIWQVKVLKSACFTVILETSDMFKRAQHWTVEENLEGSFLKYNTTAGEICTDEKDSIVFEIANAFSHWTWKQSNRTMIALDMQGVGSTFTDCALASIAQKFGFDDLGLEAIKKFFEGHKCNQICDHLKIENYKLETPVPAKSTNRR